LRVGTVELKFTMQEHPVLELKNIKGIGPAILQKLAALFILTPRDLLFHFPSQYEDRTKLVPLFRLQDKQVALIEATVTKVQVIPHPRRRLEITLQQNNTLIRFLLFNWHASTQASYKPGICVRAFGTARRFGVALTMVHPEVQFIKEGEALPTDGVLTPVYPTTQGLTQRVLRQSVAAVMAQIDALDLASLSALSSGDLKAALKLIHAPSRQDDIDALLNRTHPAFLQLIEEELLAHQLSFLKLKRDLKQEHAIQYETPDSIFKTLQTRLGFTLTDAQDRVVSEMMADLNKATPMLRLVQGDVGSGKTAVAAFAAEATLYNGYQVAIMAPTDLLAQQHYEKFLTWFAQEDEPNRVVLLSGKLKAKEKRLAQALIEKGEAKIVVGTHALFQKDVIFSKLALVIIDEQHRFGVMQRAELLNKAGDTFKAHQLIMTATPIPRTLALTLYAQLDISIIDSLPPGRSPIDTVVISTSRDAELITRLQERVNQDEQVYWVCTLIEENETLTQKAALVRFDKLKTALPHVKIGLIHGRMDKDEKLAIMQAFKNKEISVLVATTVIEVGIDVPNATLMVIENAENLGLSQLHQLRGRVGRGQKKSHCVLLYEAPLSQNAKARLEAMRETQDGFILAEKDLMLRGYGELLGERQAGSVSFKIADLSRDLHLLPKVRQRAERLIMQPDAVIDALLARWIPQGEVLGGIG